MVIIYDSVSSKVALYSWEKCELTASAGSIIMKTLQKGLFVFGIDTRERTRSLLEMQEITVEVVVDIVLNTGAHQLQLPLFL